MKRLLLYTGLVLAVIAFALPSCKKVYHSTNPTPDNYRLLSYSKVTTSVAGIVTENFRFVYDNSNKVSMIFYTTNDNAKVIAGRANLRMNFVYDNITVYKTTTDVNTSTIVQQDTFITNGSGQIVEAYFPAEVHKFAYYGKLLAKETITYRDTNTSITANLEYTSNNGDFLNRNFDGQLLATFPDSGIRPTYVPGDLYRDTELVFPLTVTWNIFNPDGSSSTATHTGVSYTDNLGGYFGNLISVQGVDVNGVATRTVFFPAGFAARQFYQVYDYLTDRTGDYLQIGSFTTYGVNIYQTTHMLYKMSSPLGTTTVNYDIDADSKVSITNAVIRDSLTKIEAAESYKLQYETY